MPILNEEEAYELQKEQRIPAPYMLEESEEFAVVSVCFYRDDGDLKEEAIENGMAEDLADIAFDCLDTAVLTFKVDRKTGAIVAIKASVQ
jgi:predicted Zn-dependent peptidase